MLDFPPSQSLELLGEVKLMRFNIPISTHVPWSSGNLGHVFEDNIQHGNSAIGSIFVELALGITTNSSPCDPSVPDHCASNLNTASLKQIWWPFHAKSPGRWFGQQCNA